MSKKKSPSKPPSSNEPQAAPDRKAAKLQMILLSLFIGFLLLAGIGVGMLPSEQETLVLGGLASLVAMVIMWMALSNLKAAFGALREKNNTSFMAFISVAAIQGVLAIIILAQIFG